MVAGTTDLAALVLRSVLSDELGIPFMSLLCMILGEDTDGCGSAGAPPRAAETTLRQMERNIRVGSNDGIIEAAVVALALTTSKSQPRATSAGSVAAPTPPRASRAAAAAAAASSAASSAFASASRAPPPPLPRPRVPPLPPLGPWWLHQFGRPTTMSMLILMPTSPRARSFLPARQGHRVGEARQLPPVQQPTQRLTEA